MSLFAASQKKNIISQLLLGDILILNKRNWLLNKKLKNS